MPRSDGDQSTPSSRASADLLIDRDRLSGVIGRPVRATRLRFKPGLSTTAVLLDAAVERSPQWIQVSHEAHVDKLRNAVRRAGDRGQQVHLHRVDGLVIAHGEIDSDPRLQRGLDSLRSAHPSVHEAVSAGRLQVLRYNPQRRLVLRRDLPHHESLVIRLTATKQVDVRATLAALAEAGVPVVEPVRTHGLRRTRRVTVWPWFGHGDLSHETPSPGAAEAALPAVTPGTAGAVRPAATPGTERVRPAQAAGAALARLHTSGVQLEPVPDPGPGLSVLVDDLLALDTVAGERMRELVQECAARIAAVDWVEGSIHGDFSADQVLVGRAGEEVIRLIDFDRAGHGPLMADLGSFAAAELLATDPTTTSEARFGGVGTLPLTTAVVHGYARTAGSAGLPTAGADLRTWLARSLLTRVTEPFRAADPDWLAGIQRRLDQVQEVLR